ncbi:Transcription repressor OFP18 [Cardamine amara subsp. amara]|uniref:Transcription repressor n=1 Tax=Cardamine amara subsp. amara TaxID=228776 RepID=A0ABD1AEN8_CARAN
MVKKMKLPFLNKTSSTSFSSNSSSSSYSWPWPSCHQQNHKKSSSKASPIDNSKPKHVYEPEPPPRSFSSSSPSISHAMKNPPEIESIENVIKGLKSSKRLIFERRGKSNSILEKATKKEEDNEEEGIMLLSMESNDPYFDFKKSMENMVEANALHHDWKSLEKLLFWFLKANVKTSHRYIFAAFVDLLLNLAVGLSKDVAGEPSSDVVVEDSPPSSSPISFYTSFSSSDETSSTFVRFLPEISIGEKSKDVCLSSLFELEEKIKDNIDSNDYVSS